MALPPRRHMPLSVKLDAALHALGLAGFAIQWDHQPPLGLREQIRDGDGNFLRYEPDENDPRYIVPMIKDGHRLKTSGRKHDASNGDIHKIAKVKRLNESQIEFRRRLLSPDPEPPPRERERPKQKIPSRKFRTRERERRTRATIRQTGEQNGE